MPFLGNTPANTFVSIAKQTITGNGGTSYSLSYPVTNANEIDVFYNNVRQEPTAAYTASGSTITFTEAIQSTDSVYVIFNGQAVGTIDAPAGAYLPTTGGTLTGNLGVGASGSTGNLTVLASTNALNIRNSTLGSGDGTTTTTVLRVTNSNDSQWSGARYNASHHVFGRGGSASAVTGMTLDGNGYLTIPNQPMISAGINQSDTNYNGDIFGNFNAITFFDVQQGITFGGSNGRFNIPITGKYYLGFYSIKNGSAPGYANIRHNDVDWLRAYSNNSSTNWSTYAAFGLKNLSAGDYINVVLSGGAGNFNAHGYHHMRLVIYLLG